MRYSGCQFSHPSRCIQGVNLVIQVDVAGENANQVTQEARSSVEEQKHIRREPCEAEENFSSSCCVLVASTYFP